MPSDSFSEACDRIARNLDPKGHEERRWEKDEGAKIAEVARLITAIFGERDDLLLLLDSEKRNARVYMLMLGAQLVANLAVILDRDSVNIYPVDVSGGLADVHQNPSPGSVPMNDINEDTVRAAIAKALSGISC